MSSGHRAPPGRGRGAERGRGGASGDGRQSGSLQAFPLQTLHAAVS